ncbi:RNA polymerase sigma factor [Actinocrispum sp. NPDC049592]|uniref:RNA polymerase sigma factor n=1 Tax=Actinocrispum sp. NPDC049592 TaxID=3154835 RepID=UPI0034445B85
MDAHRTVDAVWKLESSRIIAGLTRMVHDVGLAEELAQDALVAALERWPESGVPDNPGAWLMAIAKRRAIDHIRRAQRFEEKQEQLVRDQDTQEPEDDDVLRLMFMSCHPVLPTEARVALTLRLLGGLTTAEIARAFLTTEPVVSQRIAAAKQTLAAQHVPFEVPSELDARLNSVLEVVYLIFNEGYSATSGDDLMRPGLCLEARRLGWLLAAAAPRSAEVHGLVALMEIQASREKARTGPSGEPVQLHEQNRGRWDQLLIRRGFTAMLKAREIGGTPGPYVLQAAIAVCHAQARRAEDTDWVQIAALYQALVRLLPTPIVHLNRAVAVGMAHGPASGLELVDALTANRHLQDYHLLPGVRGDLLLKLGRLAEARVEFARAASLTKNVAEQAFLLRRAAAIPARTGPALVESTKDYLETLDAVTRRSYAQTLNRLCSRIGDIPLADLTKDQIEGVFEVSWGKAAARTWNRHRATIRSYLAWAGLDLEPDLPRRAEDTTTPEPLTREQIDEACSQAPLREQALWLLLHESGAAVTAVLALDVEDLDLDDRRATSGVSWRSATARLLPELLGDRTRGPLFLADRKPGPARLPDAADLCPTTGRSRLSYPRAERLFKLATGHTLHQLKPAKHP